MVTSPYKASDRIFRDRPEEALACNINYPAMLVALATAMGAEGSEAATYFAEFLDVSLEEGPDRDTWRHLMSTSTYFPGRRTFREVAYLEGKADGKAEGRTEERVYAILRVLGHRIIPVPTAVRERITTCTDLDALGRWLDRSFAADDAEDLFGGDDATA